LPFIEQDNLFRGIDFSANYSSQPVITHQRVATLMCPSEVNDIGGGTLMSTDPDYLYSWKFWPVNYAVNMGTWAVLTDKAKTMRRGDGAFSPIQSYTAPREFSDGLSNTVALAEVKVRTIRLSGSPNSVTYSTPVPPPSSPAELVAAPPFGL